MNRLLHSSKFWMVVLDTVVSLATYTAVQFLAPESADRVITIIGMLQVPVAFVIAGIFIEDAAAKRAGLSPNPRDN